MPAAGPKTTFIKQVLSDKDIEAALETCAQERIRTPGAIQPHGYLLVLTEDFNIVKVSANFPTALGVPLEDLLQQPFGPFTTPEKLEELKTITSEGALNPIRATPIELNFKGEPQAFDAIIHRSGRYLLLELEPQQAEPPRILHQDFYQEIMRFSVHLQKVANQGTLYDYFVNEIRRLTGFARVKLYRFDESWNGKVISESKQAHMPSYQGLSFPHSDIPKQARVLYTKNYLRMIPDVNYEPVPIVPNDLIKDSQSLDLSFSVMRSVSPVHMEYLRNMGVGASMSISIMQDGQLWGLVACHHDTPFHVRYPVRMAAELYGHTFSAFLSNFQQTDKAKEAQQREALIYELASSLNPSKSLLQTIKESHAVFLQAVKADGVLINLGGKQFAVGLTPELRFTENLVRWLEENHNEKVFASNSIGHDTALAVAGQSLASGVLAVPVSSNMRDYVVWFRQEHADDVLWAGKPEKKISKGAAGFHLTPRASFERWKDNVRGYSVPWQEEDIEAGNKIAKLLLARKNEDTLRQRQQDLNSILNNSSAFIYITDIEARILNMNDSALDAFGFKKEDVFGKSIDDLFNHEYGRIVKNNQYKVVEQQESLTFEEDFTLKEKQFHLLTVCFPLYDTNDDIYAVCTMSTDITMIRNVEQELTKSNKELERMAFIASHDLQEPIRMISSFTQLLNRDYGDQFDEQAKKYIEFMVHATARMKALISDLLNYSRLGQEPIEVQFIAPADELDRVLEQFQMLAEYTGGQVLFPSDLPEIKMKPEHFSCVMQNLIGNSLKFKHPDRKSLVTIECENKSNEWVFCVADNGIGIKEEYFEKIFMIFQRLHNDEKYAGTGIGLALSTKIVEMYGGKFSIESEESKGSKFYFTIPKNAD